MIYMFQDYSLDIERRELRRRADLVFVEPQVLDLLQYLIRNRDHVVSKDELIAAIWNGRIVSESALSSRITAVRHAVGDSGEHQRLIRTIARKGFRFVGDIQEMQTSEDGGSTSAASQLIARPTPTLFLPDKPSIAVLPFQNMSGDPEQEYFADGVVEDIIGALSRMRWLFVIARNSSFTYKGRTVDVKQVGRELGVRYVLEGSVRKSANRVRLTGQLIDAATGAHLSSERFDGDIENIFDLQDRMTASVVGAIAPKLEQAEIERAKRKPTESLDAYDYYLRAMACFYQRSRKSNDDALRLFYKAIEFDPEFATAHGMAAWCHAWRNLNGWITDRAQEIAEGARLAWRALELGKDDAVALARGGHALALLVGDLDSGAAFIDRALALDPNLARAWYASGWVRVYRGEPEVAIEHQARAMRLSPLDPTLYHMQVGTALAHMLVGRFDEGTSWAERAFREEPKYHPAAIVTVACKALAGRTGEARQAMEYLRRIDPTFRISNLKDRYPLRRPNDLARFVDGLRMAGLREA
jgi:TolB-like protein/tetratricopeptide (TPR) repeat protein